MRAASHKTRHRQTSDSPSTLVIGNWSLVIGPAERQGCWLAALKVVLLGGVVEDHGAFALEGEDFLQQGVRR
jgi:hypothetical protein